MLPADTLGRVLVGQHGYAGIVPVRLFLGTTLREMIWQHQRCEAASIACKISSLASQIRSAVSRLLVDFDVTPAQADLFYHLLDGVTSPSELVRLVGVDASNLSRQLATLERRGLIERSIGPSHRARIVVQLTAAGEMLAREVDPHARIIQELDRVLLVGCASTDQHGIQCVSQGGMY